MGLPLLTYDPGSGLVTLNFVRGPVGFVCAYEAVVHDNVATSGIRERVLERRDMIMRFSMPAMSVSGDFPEWVAFIGWALGGGEFNFSPDADGADWWHCVLEDDDFVYTRVAPGRYSASFAFRIVPDAQAPADPGVVMKRFYGIAA